MGSAKTIVIISDGTGTTAKRVLDAALAQYTDKNVDLSIVIHPQVRSLAQLGKLLENLGHDHLVIFSLIERDLNQACRDSLTQRGLWHLNALEPMLTTLSSFLGVHPDYKPGLLQTIGDRYYRKVDAIGFTVEHDDGRGHLIEQADVVLLGLSRTCKTPISMYLACNHGLKTANIPIFSAGPALERIRCRIAGVPTSRIFGVTMKPEVLMQVRHERRLLMNKNPLLHAELASYCDLRAIRNEVRFCHGFFAELNINTINVTWRAIEEISKELVDKLRQREGGSETAIDRDSRT